MHLLEDYKYGVKAEETQIQALSDDYVKFIRYAHWKINKTGKGIVGLITNHGYIDGILFRDMRQKLMKDFCKIYILNLHGSSRKKATGTGDVDQNIFDIKQGVSILFLIKQQEAHEKSIVRYFEVVGSRISKYQFLLEKSIDKINWKKINPVFPSYLFIPVGNEVSDEYMSYPSIIDIFGTGNEKRDRHKRYGAGFVSQQDQFAITFTLDELVNNIQRLLSPTMTEQQLRKEFRLCKTNQWSFKRARTELSNINWESLIIKCLYRPFDMRHTILNRNVVSIPRERIMSNLLKPNLALFIGRQGQAVDTLSWNLIFCGNIIEDYNLFRRGNNICFPLYIYDSAGNRKTNLNESVLDKIFKGINQNKENFTYTPEDIIHYIYSVLHSRKYRERYLDFLNRDFPRIPFTSRYELFSKLSKLGEQLVSLHLMKSDKLDNLITEFKGEGDNVVAAIGKNSYKEGKLSINKTQYFEGIPEAVYNFHIGGYQVCQKWLKDRKGRELTEDEIEHYQKIVVAINESIRIMKEIDEVIEEHGGWPIK